MDMNQVLFAGFTVKEVILFLAGGVVGAGISLIFHFFQKGERQEEHRQTRELLSKAIQDLYQGQNNVREIAGAGSIPSTEAVGTPTATVDPVFTVGSNASLRKILQKMLENVNSKYSTPTRPAMTEKERDEQRKAIQWFIETSIGQKNDRRA